MTGTSLAAHVANVITTCVHEPVVLCDVITRNHHRLCATSHLTHVACDVLAR